MGGHGGELKISVMMLSFSITFVCSCLAFGTAVYSLQCYGGTVMLEGHELGTSGCTVHVGSSAQGPVWV